MVLSDGGRGVAVLIIGRGMAASTVNSSRACSWCCTHRTLADHMGYRKRVICRYVWVCGELQRLSSLSRFRCLLKLTMCMRVRAEESPLTSWRCGGGGQWEERKRRAVGGVHTPQHVWPASATRLSYLVLHPVTRGIVLYSINRGVLIRSPLLSAQNRRAIAFFSLIPFLCLDLPGSEFL